MVTGERNCHFRGRFRKNRRRNDFYTCENPNIDAIFGKEDIGENDSENAPGHDSNKPDSFK